MLSTRHNMPMAIRLLRLHLTVTSGRGSACKEDEMKQATTLYPRSIRYVVTVLVALFVTVSPAWAEGPPPAEINQVTVENGLAPCDATPGFPCIIAESGSYVLSGVLDVSVAGTDAVVIRANSVTLDLEGFSIVGPGAGSGSAVSTGMELQNITVRNGFVDNFQGAAAIDLSSVAGARVVNMDVSRGEPGVVVGEEGFVDLCIVGGVAGAAIVIGDRSIVRRTIVDGISTGSSLAGNGIVAGAGSVVELNSLGAGRGTGIVQGAGCVARLNVVESFQGDGIVTGTSTVGFNLVRTCGGNGIRTTAPGALLWANVIADNARGIDPEDGTGMAYNVLSSNWSSSIDPFTGDALGINLCSGTVCP